MDFNPAAIWKINHSGWKDPVVAVVLINISLALVALLRDVFFALYLGTSAEADALLLAFFLPDTVGNNLLAAAIAASCVPCFSRLLIKNEPGHYLRCIAVAAAAFLALSLLLLALFLVFRQPLIVFFGGGFTPEIGRLTQTLFLILLPLIPVVSLCAVATALLQAHKRFNAPALAPVVFNAVWLCGILVVLALRIPPARGVYQMAGIIMAAILCMAVWLGSALIRERRKLPPLGEIFAPVPAWRQVGPELRQLFVDFVPLLLILTCSQGVLFVERILAARLEVGSVAGLNYAYRLAQFPLWVFVAAVGTVLLPAMSRASGKGDMAGLRATFAGALRLVLVLSLPLAILFFVLRVPIVSLLLQRGAFDLDSLRITTGILAGYSLAIVGQVLVYICLRVFLARGRLLPALAAGLLSALINIVADVWLVARIGSAGLGYGAALGAAVNAGILLFLLHRSQGILIKPQEVRLPAILGANLPVVLAAIAGSRLWQAVGQPTGFSSQLLFVAVVVAGSGVVYLAGLRLLQVFGGGQEGSG